MPNEFLMFPVSKSIRLGTHKPLDLLVALEKEGFLVTGVVRAIFKGPWLAETFSKKRTKKNICFATAEQITGKTEPTVGSIHESILVKGYELCSAEAGLQLRLQYPEQPRGEELWVAMEGINTVSWGPQMFGLVHGDMPKPCTLLVRAYYAVPDMRVFGSTKWAFVSND